MNISEKTKDVINIAMKVDNIDLVRQLLDVQQQALDLQKENFRLHTTPLDRFFYDSLPEIVSKSLLAGAAQSSTQVKYFLSI